MKYAQLLIYDLVGSLLLGVSMVCFEVQAKFAPGGVSGLAVMLNHLFGLPIGLMTILINIPIVVFTWKSLGLRFFLISAKSVLICSLCTDYVVPLLPVFTGARLIAALLAALTAGIAYSCFFNEGSTTGGTDFIIVAIKNRNPKLSFGLLAFLIDGSVILLSAFVYSDVMSFVYGMIYTVLTSLCLDATTWLLKKFRLTLIS